MTESYPYRSHPRPSDTAGCALTAAIIGCGRVAGSEADPGRYDLSLCHAAGYRDAGFRLTACCDTNPSALDAFGKRWKVRENFSTVDDMLANVRPDVLSICSPTSFHFAHLRAGLHAEIPLILLEKPVVGSLEEARSIIAMARNFDSVVVVNYFRRFNPALVELRKRLQNGALGVLERINVFYNKGIIHNGSHFVDLVQWYFGMLTSVWALRSGPPEVQVGHDHDPNMDILYRLGSGVPVYFQYLHHTCYHLLEVDMVFSQGRVRMTNSGRVIEVFEPREDAIFPHLRFLHPSSPVENNGWKTIYSRIMKHLADLRLGRETVPACSLNEGIAALGPCLAALESLRSGMPLCEQAGFFDDFRSGDVSDEHHHV